MTNLVLNVEDVLSPATCDLLVEFIKTFEIPSTGEILPWKEGNSIQYSDVTDKNIKQALLTHKFKVSQIVCSHYQKFVYPHLTDLVAWPAGKFMEMHVDDGTNIPKDDPAHESLAPRVFSSVTYLNDDFGGGGTFVKNEAGELFTCQPKKGSLLVFASDYRCPHGVNKVTHGTRYTLTTWFTAQPEHCEI